MSKFELNAETRHEFGKGASRRQRRLEDKVPAIMYGGGEPALPLAFQQKDLRKALENEAFYSHILTIHIDGQKHQAVLKDLQRHPYKPMIQHVDLLRITGKEKIQMSVPLHFKNDDIAPGVKVGKGIMSHLISSVDVRCLPANLPQYIEVDLSALDLDQTLHLSDLKLTAGVELVDLLHGNDRAVANIHLPRAVTEETNAAPVAAAVPASAQKAPEAAAGAKPAAKKDKK
jgi:large subunit ribosomal protein L25